jgi:hypothetical protein
MFITVKRSGYTGSGEQFCSGLFLILTQPRTDSSKYPSHSNKCSECGKTREEHDTPLPPDVQKISDSMHRMWKRLFLTRRQDNPYMQDVYDACELILNAKHSVEGCRYFRASAISYPIRAIVRHVAMRQLGHFMMGTARVDGISLTLSGSYGADGLVSSVPDEVYERGLELPVELHEAWNKGGGWNSAGSEADAMKQWALSHLKELRA